MAIFARVGWMNSVLPLLSLCVVLVLFSPGVRNRTAWQATVTPLASIIGSGFLVVAPLLGHLMGRDAWLGMSLIVLLAYGIGAVIRFNIAQVEPLLDQGRLPGSARWLERLSNLALSLAYVISVAFYLRLLSAFALRGLGMENDLWADWLTSAMLAFIGGMGLVYGLKALERLEEYSVSIKLSVIAALLLGLAVHDARTGFDLSGVAVVDWNTPEAWRVLAGLLLVVQGFETSRYLGNAYDAGLRIRSMRYAQWLSGGIYLLFVALVTPLLGMVEGGRVDETAVIDLAARAAWILGPMLILAAIMSQFSAAVADTVGAGGLVEEESRRKIPEKTAYALVTGLGIALVWGANLYEIIALASRAFALYYLLQSLLALRVLWQGPKPSWPKTTGFVLMALLLLAVVLFGKAVG